MPKRKPVTKYERDHTATHKVFRTLTDGVVTHESRYQLRAFEIHLFNETRTLTFTHMAADDSGEGVDHLRGRWRISNVLAARFRTGTKVWGADIEVATERVDELVQKYGWLRGTDGTYAYRTSVHHINRNASHIDVFGWADKHPINSLRN